ncbi:PREDICTED: uncharacterized protein LOC104715207 [Camelina sativa]|uniref:Uncharacterized protein LOC104715207 n=1 Tax=Camelina sativa TaxID=90675 RepID=A0ABM0TT53_CAMSA|nr:PREDICTED: uncharacterized protein LOC104715207 [Camelina sativa]
MAKLNNLMYTALNASGDNYLQWALDTKIHLKSKELCECIEDDNNCSKGDKYKAIMYIRHHMDESLKSQYLTIEDPLELWTELTNKYGHQKMVLLPKAQVDWKTLRVQDFKSMDRYNLELFKIASRLKLCGIEVTDEDLIEKTLSTYYTNDILLQQQIRERSFKTYASLISCLYAESLGQDGQNVEHPIDLYQENLKKNQEANLVHLDGEGDFDHENDDQLDYETSDCLKEDN